MRRISDKLCLEHGLSIVEDPKPSRGHYGKWLGDGNKPLSFQNQIRQAIDAALEQHPSTFEDFLKILETSGVEVTRRGKDVYKRQAQTLAKDSRIGQLIIMPVVIADFVNDLGGKRGAGAFGSTGK